MNLNSFDRSKLNNDPYGRKIEKPWGYEILWVSEGMPYMGKIIHVNAGRRLSLQIHDQKQETQMLINGECNLLQGDNKGELVTINMEKNKGYTTKVGQRHRLHAVTDCDLIEISTPEMGTTYRLEDDFKRFDETEEIRKKDRGEI